MEAIEKLDIKQMELIDEISKGNITNDNLDLLYKILMLKSQIKESGNNAKISTLYSKYINARKLYILDQTAQNKKNLITCLEDLLDRCQNMFMDISNSALVSEEKEAVNKIIHNFTK